MDIKTGRELSRIILIGLLIVSAEACGLDKFDLMVCDAQSTEISQIECYQKLKMPDVDCKMDIPSELLSCLKEHGESHVAQAEKVRSLNQEQAAKKMKPIQIPRSTRGDKGAYFLIGTEKSGDIIVSVHKRVGVFATGYTKTEIDCNKRRYRELGYSERSAESIKPYQFTEWTDLFPGSSKSDLVEFVCSRH